MCLLKCCFLKIRMWVVFYKDYSQFQKKKYKYLRNSRGAIRSSQVEEEDIHCLPSSYHFRFHNFGAAKRPSDRWVQKHKTTPRKKGGSESHSFFMCPNSVSKGVHSFPILWLNKDFGWSYYSWKSSLPIMYDYGSLSRPMKNGNNPCSTLEVLEEGTKAIGTLFVCLFVCNKYNF